MASGSLLNFLISFSSCRPCMEGTPSVRAALTVEAAVGLCRGAQTEQSLEFSGDSRIAQDTGSARFFH
jgi:hypothetical protein